MLKTLSVLLIAGLCITGNATAQAMGMSRIDVTQNNVDEFRGDTSDEHWRDGDGIGEHERNADRVESTATVQPGPQVAGDSARVESQTQVTSDQTVAASDAKAPPSSDRADRTGPVPFADLGEVGGSNEQLSTEKAIEQDRQLLVRGEVQGDDLVIQLPAGTHHDTLSLRSSQGLNLSRADVARLGRFDGDCLKLRMSDIGVDRDNLGNLWVWGTGPDSASLLQRVAMTGVDPQPVASNDQDVPQRRSAGASSTLGAPLNEPNMMSDQESNED